MINTKRRERDIIITEKQIIKNKISNERVLRFAMNLGLLSRENYEYMKTIGKSKRVGDLMKELSNTNLENTARVLRGLLRRGYITIHQNEI